MIDLLIRVEKESDFRTVENLTRQAFWNLYCPGASQHFIIHQMRRNADFIPELSLVAELNGQVIGHILYSLSKVTYQNGTVRQTLTFGPVSIRPDFQLKGIGSALIRQSISRAKNMGYKGVIILGYPNLYQRFNFKSSHNFKIKATDNNYYIGMQVLELQQGYFPKDMEGVFQQSKAFSFCTQQFEEYEKNFQHKQKFQTISQKIFQEVSLKKWGQPLNFEFKDAFNRQKLNAVQQK